MYRTFKKVRKISLKALFKNAMHPRSYKPYQPSRPSLAVATTNEANPVDQRPRGTFRGNP
jgi:hypothetical protein